MSEQTTKTTYLKIQKWADDRVIAVARVYKDICEHPENYNQSPGYNNKLQIEWKAMLEDAQLFQKMVHNRGGWHPFNEVKRRVKK